MKRATKLMMALALLAVTLAPVSQGLAGEKKPLIQMAILLDTSNSMDGLINQAKSVRSVMSDLIDGYYAAVERLQKMAP